MNIRIIEIVAIKWHLLKLMAFEPSFQFPYLYNLLFIGQIMANSSSKCSWGSETGSVTEYGLFPWAGGRKENKRAMALQGEKLIQQLPNLDILAKFSKENTSLSQHLLLILWSVDSLGLSALSRKNISYQPKGGTLAYSILCWCHHGICWCHSGLIMGESL